MSFLDAQLPNSKTKKEIKRIGLRIVKIIYDDSCKNNIFYDTKSLIDTILPIIAVFRN